MNDAVHQDQCQPSERAIQMIIGWEVTSPTAYARTGARPSWPGGSSGVTIGIGYDVGTQPAAQVRADWGDILSPTVLDRLMPCAGRTGPEAQVLASALTDIVVPLDLADQVFRRRSIARALRQTLAIYPSAATLPPDCLGALVSLVFNRGPGLTDPPNDPGRRREMRQIGQALAGGRPELVPDLFRSMKRIWEGKGQGGLLARRDAEAALFAQGLAGMTVKA